VAFVVAAAVGHVVWIQPHGVAQGGVGLDGQIIPVVVHVEHGLGGVNHAPDDHDAYLDGIAQQIVYLLLAIIVGDGLQRDLLAGGGVFFVQQIQRAGSVCRRGRGRVLRRAGFPHGGVHAHAEGIYIEKSGIFQTAVIVAEQGQHQRLVGLDYFQPGEGHPRKQPIYRANDHHCHRTVGSGHAESVRPGNADSAQHEKRHGRRQQQYARYQYAHTADGPGYLFLSDKSSFFHLKVPSNSK